MQIKMQAFARRGGSLRQRITRDLETRGHERLYLERSKSVERSPGWAKIKATGVFGAINIEWDSNQQMLTARAIAKKGHLPHELLGIFLAYLTQRHGRRISSINIQLT
jgi:hypothetical protein